MLRRVSWLFVVRSTAWPTVDTWVQSPDSAAKELLSLPSKDLLAEEASCPQPDSTALGSYVEDFGQRVFSHGVGTNVTEILEPIRRRARVDAEVAGRMPTWMVTPARAASRPFSFAECVDSRRGLCGSAATALAVEHARWAVASARRSLSSLSSSPRLRQVLELEGMSDSLGRHLLNNLASAGATRYLEVGTWRGSTLVSAVAGNEKAIDAAVAVDSWDEAFLQRIGGRGGDDAKRATRDNLDRFVRPLLRRGRRVDLVQGNCFNIDPVRDLPLDDDEHGGPANVYFFDGPHSYDDHVKAFTHFAPALADTFIAIVDDFAAAGVSDATAWAFGQMGFIVHYGEILASGTPVNAPGAAWHNAIYVAVVQKPPAAVSSTS